MPLFENSSRTSKSISGDHAYVSRYHFLPPFTSPPNLRSHLVLSPSSNGIVHSFLATIFQSPEHLSFMTFLPLSTTNCPNPTFLHAFSPRVPLTTHTSSLHDPQTTTHPNQPPQNTKMGVQNPAKDIDTSSMKTLDSIDLEKHTLHPYPPQIRPVAPTAPAPAPATSNSTRPTHSRKRTTSASQHACSSRRAAAS
jgi:hypothetical protein